MKFLKINFQADTEEDFDAILSYMQSTTGRPEIINEDGDVFIEIRTDVELVDELLCIGSCLQHIEDAGYSDALYVELVELDEAPHDIDEAPVYLQ